MKPIAKFILLVAAILALTLANAEESTDWATLTVSGEFRSHQPHNCSLGRDCVEASGNRWYSLNLMKASADGGDFSLELDPLGTINDDKFYFSGIIANDLGATTSDLADVSMEQRPANQVLIYKGHYYLLRKSIYYTVIHVQDLLIEKQATFCTRVRADYMRDWTAKVTVTGRVLSPLESLDEVASKLRPERKSGNSRQPMSIGHYYLVRSGDLAFLVNLIDFRADSQATASFRYFDPRKSTWIGPFDMRGELTAASSLILKQAWRSFQKGTPYFALGLQRAVASQADLAFKYQWNGTDISTMRCLITGDEKHTYDLGIDPPAVVSASAEDGFSSNSVAVLNQALRLAQEAKARKSSAAGSPDDLTAPGASTIRIVPETPPPSVFKMVTDNMLKILLACAAFIISFGMSSFFMRDIFPWKKESPVFSNILSFLTAFFLSGVFAAWLFTAQAAQQFIDQISKGFAGILTKVIALLFAMIGGYLFWKRIKRFFKIGE